MKGWYVVLHVLVQFFFLSCTNFLRSDPACMQSAPTGTREFFMIVSTSINREHNTKHIYESPSESSKNCGLE